jgi:hypothetical protein
MSNDDPVSTEDDGDEDDYHSPPKDILKKGYRTKEKFRSSNART